VGPDVVDSTVDWLDPSAGTGVAVTTARPGTPVAWLVVTPLSWVTLTASVACQGPVLPQALAVPRAMSMAAPAMIRYRVIGDFLGFLAAQRAAAQSGTRPFTLFQSFPKIRGYYPYS
jgi:hypothetical protein